MLLDGLLWAAGKHYRRRKVTVTDRDGHEYQAWIYVACKEAPDFQSNRGNIQSVVREAKTQGLPDLYIDKLVALAETSVAVSSRQMRVESPLGEDSDYDCLRRLCRAPVIEIVNC